MSIFSSPKEKLIASLRIERKFLGPNGLDGDTALAMIRSVLPELVMDFPSRSVISLYLEDPDYLSLQQNYDGLGQRRKHRIRWYGKLDQSGLVAFEQKSRVNRYIQKTTVHKPLAALSSLLRWYQAEHGLLQPAVLVAYRRQYLRIQGSAVRFTVDDQIRVGLPLVGDPIEAQLKAAPSSRVVVEVKSPAGSEAMVANFTNRLPWPEDPFSKFANGMRWLSTR